MLSRFPQQPWKLFPKGDPQGGGRSGWQKLALVTVEGVIAFGALISVGRERQRRAIASLHQAHKQWAVQDLRLKRGTVSSQNRIEDVTVWLTKITSLALGHRTNVMDYQVHNTPVPTVEFHDMELGSTILCALEAPSTLLPMLRTKSSGIRGELRTNPVLRIDRKTPSLELSMLNAGAMSDVELPLVWNTLTGQTIGADILWVYVLD